MTWHLSIEIDRESAESLTKQIQSGIRCRIAERILHPGARLPSTRQLADDLGVSRSVVVEAYEQLTAEGYLASKRGSGTRVAERGAEPVPGRLALRNDPQPPEPVAWDLRTGRANVTNFPRAEWLACYRSAMLTAGPEDLDYPPVAGLPALREALSRTRGVCADTRTVMVTAGFAQGLSLLCEKLLRLGIHTVALEDPGHAGQRRFVEDCGMRVEPIPVDEEGLDVELLAASGARAVLVTPAHQFPTGVTMTASRRAALINWAEEVEGLVIEDDYDGEFWFDRQQRPTALQGMAPDRVIYAGTVSKTLVPGLRLGWAVSPAHLSGLLDRVKARHDLGSDATTQRAFAELLDGGLFDRHLRRVRSRYRARHEALVQAVAAHLPEARIAGSHAGLHAYLRLPQDVDESRFVAAAMRRSVLVHGGSRYQFAPGRRPPALVIGYTTLPLAGIGESMAVLGEALAERVVSSPSVPPQVRRGRPQTPRVPAGRTRRGLVRSW